jgi:heat shock protein HslJ
MREAGLVFSVRTSSREAFIRNATIAGWLLLAACAPKQPAPAVIDPTTLGGVTWRLEELAGRGVIDNSHVTIEFLPDGNVTGSGGCNRYSGSATLKGPQITFTPLASTMMACAPELMDQEMRFYAALGKASTVSFDKTGALLIQVTGEPKPLLFRKET